MFIGTHLLRGTSPPGDSILESSTPLAPGTSQSPVPATVAILIMLSSVPIPLGSVMIWINDPNQDPPIFHQIIGNIFLELIY